MRRRREMGRRSPVWTTAGLVLLLLLPAMLIAATEEDPTHEPRGGGEEDEEEWEEIEDDDEVSLAAASSRATGRAVKALPQLTDQNANRVLGSSEHVLLLGYAAWCKQSAKVMIDFAEAAGVLAAKGSPAVLVKLDAIANPVTASRYMIKGYPTIVFVTNSSGELYTAGQTRDDIVTWVQKRTGRAATTFTTKAEAEQIQRAELPVIIGLFEKLEGPEHDEFIASSLKEVEIDFVQTTSAEAARVFHADFGDSTPALAVWKSQPEKFVKYGGEMKRSEILPFVALNKFALITKVNARNSAKVYGSLIKKQVLLFSNSYDYDSVYPFYLAAARYFKGELLFLWVDTEDEDFAKPMMSMYGIAGSEPTVAGFDNTNGSKYLLELEVNRPNLKAFCVHFKEGRLKVHYKSEPIPKKNKGDVKIVVGKTLDKLVLKSSKDVFLMVYTDYCKDCDSLSKVFVKLAKHFKDVSSITFAKVDAAANEHPELQVQNFPAFLYYTAGSKGSPPIIGPEKPTYRKLVRFVENHGGLVSSNDANDSSDSEHTPLKESTYEGQKETLSEEVDRVKSESTENSEITDALRDAKVEVIPEHLAEEALHVPKVTNLEAADTIDAADSNVPKSAPVNADILNGQVDNDVKEFHSLTSEVEREGQQDLQSETSGVGHDEL